MPQCDLKYIDPSYMIRAAPTITTDRIYCKVRAPDSAPEMAASRMPQQIVQQHVRPARHACSAGHVS
jgi:hypothetical protein